MLTVRHLWERGELSTIALDEILRLSLAAAVTRHHSRAMVVLLSPALDGC